MKDGKLRPDVEKEEFKQIEGALGELKKYRRMQPALEKKLADSEAANNALKTQLATVRREIGDAAAAAARL